MCTCAVSHRTRHNMPTARAASSAPEQMPGPHVNQHWCLLCDIQQLTPGLGLRRALSMGRQIRCYMRINGPLFVKVTGVTKTTHPQPPTAVGLRLHTHFTEACKPKTEHSTIGRQVPQNQAHTYPKKNHEVDAWQHQHPTLTVCCFPMCLLVATSKHLNPKIPLRKCAVNCSAC